MAALLTIETSTPACSVALQVDGRLVSRYSEEPRSHTQLVMSMVDEVLIEAQVKIDQVDVIGVTVGPGSFTGLRVGLSFAKGFSYAIKCPIIPVPTILAMAYGLRLKKPLSGIIRSHGEKIFFQEFIWDKQVPSIKNKPVLGNIHNYLEKVKDGFHFNCEEFLIDLENIYKAKPSAKNIATLANIYFQKWNIPKPYNLTSEYIYPYIVKSND